MHTFKKDNDFSIHSESGVAMASLSRSRYKMSTHIEQDRLPSQNTHTNTHNPRLRQCGHTQLRQCAQLLVIGGTCRPQRKSTQTWGTHAHSTLCVWPWLEIGALSYQCYDKMPLNKITSLEALLQIFTALWNLKI